jgi:hypothetical protein
MRAYACYQCAKVVGLDLEVLQGKDSKIEGGELIKQPLIDNAVFMLRAILSDEFRLTDPHAV